MKKTVLPTRLKSERGIIQVVIMILIAIGVLISSLSLQNYYVLRRRLNMRLIYHQNLLTQQQNILTLLSNSKAFLNTASAAVNPGFWDCISNPSVLCGPVATPQKLTLYNDAGEVFLAAGASDGLTTDMKPCTSYSSLFCPFKMELTWSVECPTAMPCRSPGVTVTVSAKVAPEMMQVLSLDVKSYTRTIRIR